MPKPPINEVKSYYLVKRGVPLNVIAEELKIKAKTIKRHLRNLEKKHPELAVTIELIANDINAIFEQIKVMEQKISEVEHKLSSIEKAEKKKRLPPLLPKIEIPAESKPMRDYDKLLEVAKLIFLIYNELKRTEIYRPFEILYREDPSRKEVLWGRPMIYYRGEVLGLNKVYGIARVIEKNKFSEYESKVGSTFKAFDNIPDEEFEWYFVHLASKKLYNPTEVLIRADKIRRAIFEKLDKLHKDITVFLPILTPEKAKKIQEYYNRIMELLGIKKKLGDN